MSLIIPCFNSCIWRNICRRLVSETLSHFRHLYVLSQCYQRKDQRHSTWRQCINCGGKTVSSPLLHNSKHWSLPQEMPLHNPKHLWDPVVAESYILKENIHKEFFLGTDSVSYKYNYFHILHMTGLFKDNIT